MSQISDPDILNVTTCTNNIAVLHQSMLVKSWLYTGIGVSIGLFPFLMGFPYTLLILMVCGFSLTFTVAGFVYWIGSLIAVIRGKCEYNNVHFLVGTVFNIATIMMVATYLARAS